MTFKKEIERLHALGWGLHWLKPNSKAPVESGWTTRERESLDSLKKSYRKGNGLGVRLGRFSFLGEGNGYLAVIDVDVKGGKEHQLEALRVLESTFPGIRRTAPCVKTGRGFHFYVRTKEPVKSGKVKTSHEEVTHFSPSSPISRRQEEKLTPEEIKNGMRVKNAWEVDFMSEGRQVVLPPTIHPDTKEPYTWVKEVPSLDSLPWVEGTERPKGEAASSKRGRPEGSTVVQGFEPIEVDLVSSRLSDTMVDAILTGEGVEDRSASCFSACLAMLKAGFSETEILSVLTDRSTFLGETAYDHRKTDSRKGAAAWVRDYCLKKAQEMVDAARVFAEEVSITPLLTDDEADAQLEELVGEGDWRLLIDRSGKNGDGPPKPSLKNTVYVLSHAVNENLFQRDLFALRDFYNCDAPWPGGTKGAALTDDDPVQIKLWLAQNYRFEPSVQTVCEAMTSIATKNGFHPVREELLKLPAWDGVGRLDGWLGKNFEAKGHPEYLAQVFRKWMVASITRTFRPGWKFDWMPIFQGAQGTGKSSFGAILFGQAYFNDYIAVLTDKDAALGLQGIRCQEFSELESLRKNEVETIKAFVTRQVDKVRPPYGRRWIESARQCVFFGTTNRDEYLKDDTGNRRFCPVEVGKLNFELLRLEREQLWAEALFIFQNELEESLYLTGAAETFAEELRADKLMPDEGEIMLAHLIKEEARIVASDGVLLSPLLQPKFKVAELFLEGGPLHLGWVQNQRNLMLAAKCLKLIRYEKIKVHGTNYWRKPPEK